jgi:4-hydroxybenzoate polyprenyltransferase
MGASLAIVVHRATGRPFSTPGLMLFLCGIVAAYSLDRVLDRPQSPTHAGVEPLLVGVAALSSFGCAFAVLRLPFKTASLLPLIAGLAVWYPKLKRPPLAKTLLVAAVWTWTAIAFPFGDQSWFGWRIVMTPVAIPILLLVASGCLLCDLKDVESDRLSQVRSLPVLLGKDLAARVAIGVALAALALAVTQNRPGLAVCGLALAGLGLRPRLLAREAIGPLVVDAALTLPGLLIATHLV